MGLWKVVIITAVVVSVISITTLVYDLFFDLGE